MSKISDYLENKIIDATLRGQTYAGTSVYVGLFTSDPTDAGTGAEATGASYARQQAAFNVPVDGQTTNSADILFPIATESWGTITHIGLFDAPAGGNLLYHGQLEFAKTINISSQFKLPANYLIVRIK